MLKNVCVVVRASLTPDNTKCEPVRTGGAYPFLVASAFRGRRARTSKSECGSNARLSKSAMNRETERERERAVSEIATEKFAISRVNERFVLVKGSK